MSEKLLVGQAGGATAVINSSLAGIVAEATQLGSFSAVWGMRRAAEGALREEFVDLGALDEPTVRALAGTPGAALGSSRHRLSDDDVAALLAIFDRHHIRYLLYVGGNDSADTVHRLHRAAVEKGQALHAIAVPKTIDNDLPITDHCPGYGSIARYVAIAAMDSAKDTESMPTMYPIKFIEVMGRDAGWVAAASALSKVAPEDAPHLIYVPERPVSRERLLQEVAAAYQRHGRVVAVVTETLRDERGEPFADPAQSAELDAFGHPLLRGTADTLCRMVQNELGLRARFDKPGSLQRMSMLCASSVDLQEAAAVGRAAVRAVLRGESDCMVTLVREGNNPYRWATGLAPLQAIANRQKLLPDEFIAPDGRDVTLAFKTYAMPLLGPDPFPHYLRLPAMSAIRFQ